MTKLDIAKEIIKQNYDMADCGLFYCRNWVGDPMTNIYDDGELAIDICYPYLYFEVFGLSKEDCYELTDFYNNLENNKE